MLYVLMIEKGLKTLDQVPQSIREQVQIEYDKRNGVA